MRILDLLGLSLSALWLQKVRILLTTLGVVFGSLVLAISLSVREGVQETILDQYQKFGELRLIEIYQNRGTTKAKPPPEQLKIQGKMSDAKRKRLEQEITERWQHGYAGMGQGQNPITPAHLRELESMEHVKGVKPFVQLFGRASLGNKTENTSTLGVAPDDSAFQEKIVAGQMFPRADSESVLVSEYLLYQLGIVDDDAVQDVLGKKLRLEFQDGGPSRYSVLSLFQASKKALSAGEEKLLEQIAARLPMAVAKMDLSAEEKVLVQKLLAEQTAKPAAKAVTISRDLTICGVMAVGETSTKKRRLSWGWAISNLDVALPIKTAEQLFLSFPQSQKHGFHRVIVEVDDIDHVKEVNARIKAKGMETYALVEFIEREQFTYMLIFSSMTIVALITLLVAALGITNTMLMSVLEHVREIGIMKAVGAREMHIRVMFLVEGGLIGLVGGLLGLFAAWGASIPANAWVKSMVESRLDIQLESSIFVFPWWLNVSVPFFAWLVTTLAAYYPARRAARTDPIKALRHE